MPHFTDKAIADKLLECEQRQEENIMYSNNEAASGLTPTEIRRMVTAIMANRNSDRITPLLCLILGTIVGGKDGQTIAKLGVKSGSL